MTILRNRRLNGGAYLLSLPSPPASTSDDQGFMMGVLGVGGGTGASPAPSSAMSQPFTLANWGSASSLAAHKRGVWFKKGEVPAGSSPALSNGTAQFYALTYWSDGSLKTARMLLRDTALGAGASRNYMLTNAPGAMSAGSTAAVGNAGLVAALAGHDIKATFANVQTWDCSSTTGNYAALGSGSFTASLTTHAATATRWTLLTTGPVADVWQGWGMATDATSGAADLHLKVNWYVTRWKAADGTTLGLQIGAVVALDWWSVANKFFLLYDAALLDGATTLASLTGQRQPYQSQRLLCVNDTSLNAGTAPWTGATQPTLHCSFDRDYAVAAGVVPPLDTAKRPTPALRFTLGPDGLPLDPSGGDHINSHRTAIDGTGGYNGRGPITRFDADAFMVGTAEAYAVARVNALSGLSVPYHYRSNRVRTRPGDATADTANTIIPVLMRPKAASFSDYTTAGLPLAVDAYNGNGSPGTSRDSFVWQTGIQSTSDPNRAQEGYLITAGANGPWGPSLDASHGVSYCYFMALVSGDEWLVEAQIDLATNLVHQGIYGYHNFVQAFPAATSGGAAPWNPACPADRWTGLMAQWQADAIRSLGWAQLIQGHAAALVPADHVAYGYMRAAMTHNGDFIQTNLDYAPADFAATPYYSPDSQLGLFSLYSPWMNAFIPVCAYSHYLLNEDARWKRLGDFCATWTLKQAALGRWYAFDLYRTAHRRKRDVWNASTNPQVPAEQQVVLQLGGVNLDAPSGTFSATQGAFWSSTGVCPPPLSNGDQVLFTSETDGGASGVIPAGAAEGQTAYIVGLANGDKLSGRNAPTTPPTFKLAATPGGAPLAWSTSVTGLNLGFFPQAASSVQIAAAGADYLSFPYIPDWGNYVPIHISVIMMARLAGNPACTTAIRDGALAFTAPMDNSSAGYYSAFDMAVL